MFKFLSKQIPFPYRFKKHLWIGLLLGGIITFIMIFLQPFGTYRFESDKKYLIFSGFGLLFFLVYLLWGSIENTWYDSKNKRWEVKHEAVSFLFFMLIASVPIHFYNQVFLNDFFNTNADGFAYVKHGLWFFQHSMVPIMVILLPFFIYFRNKFGELITPETLTEITLSGINKGENITLQKDALLFIKASENYVNIYYVQDEKVQYETFRNTLTVVHKQAPFLLKSHRSYLVNATTIKTMHGNSQNAKIVFHYDGVEIPLSKSYYKTIKKTLGVQPKK